MAFDFGTKQIGVAVGQTVTKAAQALTILKANNGAPDWQIIDLLVQEWQPDAFVVGLPLNMDGSVSHMSGRARKFSNRLTNRYHKPCHLVDERLSSVEARVELQTFDVSKKKKPKIDSFAAAVILRSWLAEYNPSI
jgi:putative holliday junction resolvase